jgi:O-antigen/teichoic acid export membrane protein
MAISFFKKLIHSDLGRNAWSITDQGAYSGANFLSSFMLASWLSHNEFGSYCLCNSIMLLLGTLQTAFITEPMLVFGSTKFSHNSTLYLKVILKYNYRIGIFCSLLLFISGIIIWIAKCNPEISLCFYSMALAVPAIFVSWTVRRFCYIALSPVLAAMSSILYLCSIMASLFLLKYFNLLSGPLSIIAIGISSYLSSFYILQFCKSRPDPEIDRSDVVSTHLRYGKWSVFSNLLAWAPENVYYLLIPYFASIEMNAIFRIYMLMIMPISQLYLSISIQLLPRIAKIIESRKLFSIFRYYVLGFIALAIINYVVLVVAQRIIMRSLKIVEVYPIDHYCYYLMGLIPIFSGLNLLACRGLMAMNRPKYIVISQTLAFFTNAIIGILLLNYSARLSPIIGNITGSIFSALLTWIILFRLHQKIFVRQEK